MRRAAAAGAIAPATRRCSRGGPASVAAPTAGLHFTGRLFERLARAGVQTAFVTLDVGPGTFRPIRHDDLAEHLLEPGVCRDPSGDGSRDRRRPRTRHRVVAVGTTVTRTLETFADGRGGVFPARGPAGLFIRPGHRFQVVDALVTNFHLPKSSLLVLAAAFAGRERLLAAYEEAVAALPVLQLRRRDADRVAEHDLSR